MIQDRIIIDDPLFGSLSYHKKFLNNSEFNGSQYLCAKPFTFTEINQDGKVNICCENWNPASIGNVLEQSLEAIWNGERAQVLRQTILDGSYRYCNFDTCPRILHKSRLLDNTASNRVQLLDKSNHATPEIVHFSIDRSCNLECPSCRIQKISKLNDQQRDRGHTILTRVLDSMFPSPHQQYKMLSMDGSGEVFNSEIYRSAFDSHPVFTQTHLWPNLRFRLLTNGTMMTAKIQNKYQHILNHLEEIEVSVDAGNRESYEKVRVGGRWDLLWDNLQYFYENTLNSNKRIHWAWNIIIQQNNYKSLPELIDLANKFTDHTPVINVSNLFNWGTWSETEYLDHAVHLPSHPQHQNFLAVMSSPKVSQYSKLKR